MVWGLFLPITLGPDAVRAVHTSPIGIDSNKALASMMIERAIGIVSAAPSAILGLSILFFSGLVG